MAAVAQLKAMVGLDTRAYKAGSRDIARQNQQLRRSFANIGRAIGISFSVGAVVAAGRSLMKYATEVSLAARSTGMLTSEVMALNQVAITAGMGVSEMQRLSARLSSTLFQAANGSDQAREKFERMGLEIADLAAMDPAQMLEHVAQAAFESGIPLQNLTELFGERLGPAAMNALRDIADNGLPPVDKKLGEQADTLEMLGSQWAVYGDKVKQATLGAVAWLGRQHAEITDFWGGFFARGGEEQGGGGFGMAADSMFEGMKRREDELDRRRKKRDEERAETQSQMVEIALDTEEKRRMEIAEKEAELRQREQDKLLRDLNREREREQRQSERIRERLARDLDAATGTGIDADALARVGGFLGGERAGLAVSDKQLRVQEIMRDYLQQINGSLETIANIEQRIAGGGI
jgi:hypothetical protein